MQFPISHSRECGKIDPFNKKGFDRVLQEIYIRDRFPKLMKIPSLLVLSALAAISGAQSSDRINVAEDEASHSAYNGGWESGKSSGTGFGAWTLRTFGGVQHDSHAGSFIANASTQNDLDSVATAGKAFGLFANGVDFEVACAFRGLDAPLAVGDSFSLLMECSNFVKKFETDDPRPGIIGFSLRTGSASESWDDFQNGARMQFGFYQGEENYQVYDGQDDHDTGVPFSDKGVSVAVTLVSPDAYDLEITQLDTKETKKLAGRKLAGDAGAPIESFAIYNQDGETGDAYFNGFQVSRVAASLPR